VCIGGYYGFNAQKAMTDVLTNMMEQLRHRGTAHYEAAAIDAMSVGYSCQPGQSAVARQTICVGDQSDLLVFDGNLYNQLCLQEILIKEGSVLNKPSDTETALCAIRQWGVQAAVARFNGMFGFVYYDSHGQELWLARDRLGIKPLYYAVTGGAIVFASEIKAILQHPYIGTSIDTISLLSYLSHNNIDRIWTMFKGIEAVMPGAVCCFQQGKMRQIIYYDPIDALDVSLLSAKWSRDREFELASQLDALLEKSVCSALKDGAVGLFCSGGIDSSLLCAYTNKNRPDVVLYTADVENARPELIKAAFVAKRLKLPLHVTQILEDDFLKGWPSMIRHNEQPSFFRSDLAVYHLTKACRQDGIRTVLSGEGGDELFGGYQWYYGACDIWSEYRASPGNGTFPHTPLKYFALKQILNTYVIKADVNAARELCDMYLDGGEQYSRYIRLFEKIAQILPEEQTVYLSRNIVDWYDRMSQLLHRTDRMGMAASVECRIPYLNNEILDFAIQLPVCYKYKDGKVKSLLKQVGSRYLPDLIVNSTKLGFSTNGDAYRYAIPLLRGGMLTQLLKVGRHLEDTVLEKAATGTYNQYLLYQLASAELFLRIYGDGQSPQRLGEILLENKYQSPTV